MIHKVLWSAVSVLDNKGVYLMLDKSIPFYSVLMIKHNTSDYPRYELPEGFEFVGYSDGLEYEWARIEYELDQFSDIGSAVKCFKSEFNEPENILNKTCFFIKAPNGEIVGIASLWHGDAFDRELPRVHWVAVDKAFHGLGLAKALITRIMDAYHENNFSDPIYLVTQTWSYKAINIYYKFGFEAYLGEKPHNWYPTDYDEMNPKAWAMINEKIAARNK